MRRVGVLAFAFAVLASLAPATFAQEPLAGGAGFAVEAARAEADATPLGGPRVESTPMRVPQLNLQVSGADAARVGGTGSVSATLTRRSATGLAVARAVVHLRAPAGVTMTGGTGAGWACTPAGRLLRCSHPGRIPSGRNPDAITATFRVAPTAARLARAASASFVGYATWAGDPADATIGGPWLETDTGEVDVRDALRVTLDSASGSRVAVTTGADETLRRIDLVATVRGADTGQVRAEWFQVSGPTVAFAAPTTLDSTTPQLAQAAIVPDTATGTGRYVFGVRVSGDGDVVERRVAVQVVASAMLPREPFDQSQVERLVDIAQRDFGDRTLTNAYLDDFDIAGPRRPARPGSTVTLRLVDIRVPLVQTGWIVDDVLVTAAKTNRQRLTVTAPSYGDSMSVEVVAVDRKGKTYSEGIVIVGGQPVGRSDAISNRFVLKPAQPTAQTRQAQRAATAEQEQAMCDTVTYLFTAYNDFKDEGNLEKGEIFEPLPGGLTLVIPAKKLKVTAANGNNLLADVGDCKTATVEFKEARLELDPLANTDEAKKKATLSKVKGGFTAVDGLKLTEAEWAPDVPYTKYVPTAGRWEGSVTAAFTGPSLERNPAGTPKNGGELAALTGQFRSAAAYFDGKRKYAALIVSQVKLPGGYTILDDSARLSFLNEAVDKVPDGTVRVSEQFTNMPENADPKEYSGGRIALHVDRTGDRYTAFGVSVSNMVLGETATGDTIEISGTGSKAFADPNALVGEEDPASSIKLRVGCYRVEGVGVYAIREVVNTCEVFKGLAFKEFNLDWSAKKLELSGQVEITADPSNPVRLGVKGEYVSAQDWKVAVSGGGAAPWTLDGGLNVRDITGTIGRTPKAPDSTEGVMTASLRGVLDGISFSEGVSGSLGAEITNECPKETKQPGKDAGGTPAPEGGTTGTCSVGDIKLRITGTVTAKLTKAGNQDTILVDGAYDFGRKRFRVQASYTGTSLSVDGLALKEAHLVVTNEKEQCVKKGQEPDDTGRIKVQIGANLDILNKPVGVMMMTGPSGVCLVGQAGTIDLKGGLKTKSGTVAYSDYTGGADIIVDGKRSTLAEERAVTLRGSMELPSAMSTSLKTDPANLSYVAALSTKGAQFTVAYTPMGGSATLYQSNDAATRLLFTGGEFRIAANWANGMQASVHLVVRGSVETAAGADGTPASSTPVAIQAGFEFENATWRMSLGIGADIEQGKAVENAFGQQGLTLRGLWVQAAFSLPGMAPSLSILADATLPDYMGRTVGIVNDAPVKFAANLDLQAPCFDIQIGSEGRTENALDLANKGIITARYLRMYLAPWGCTITANAKGEKITIPAGWGLKFDGSLLGGEVSVAFGAQITPQVFRVKTDLVLPAIDLYVASLTSADGQRGAVFKIDIDTAAKRYNFEVDAALEIGSYDNSLGAKVAVKGALKTDDPDAPGKITFDIKGSGGIRLTPLVRGDIKTLTVQGSISKGADKSKDWAKGSLDVEIYILGQTLGVSGDVDYRDGQLAMIQAQIKVSLNIIIARLDGQLNFDYCLGTLSRYENDGKKPVCTLFTGTQDATPQTRVGVRGTYRILWWTNGYVWVPYDQPGKEGTPPAVVRETEPLVVPGEVPEGLGDDGVTAAYLKATGGDIRLTGMQGADTGATYILKTIKGRQAMTRDGRDAPACDASRLGAVWEPSEADPNPKPAPLDPVAQRPGEACGIEVQVWSDRGNDRTDGLFLPMTFVCDAAACMSVSERKPISRWTVVAGRSDIGAGDFPAKVARDKLLAGLRVPPGLIAAPVEFEDEQRILAGDGRTELIARPYKANSPSGVLELRRDGRTVWKLDAASLDIQGLRLVRTFFTPIGTFKFCALIDYSYRGNDPQCPGSTVPWNAGISVPQATSASRYPVAIVRNGTLAIYASSDLSPGNLVWGVRADGSCFAGPLVANTGIPASFCTNPGRTPYPARP
jgi:hypothetical protein